MTQSTIVGTIEELDKKIPQYKHNDEQFYTLKLFFEGFAIPLVVSEYLLDGVKGKVAVTGYLNSTYIRKEGRKRQLFTYFQVIDITGVSDSIEDYDIVNVDVEVTHVGEYTTKNRYGRAFLPIIGKSHIGDDRWAVIHLLAIERFARQLKKVQVGDHLVCKGHFHHRGEPIQLVISQLSGKEEVQDVG